jgi:hypothetical protein
MTPPERKIKSELLLRSLQINLPDELPAVEDVHELSFRSGKDIARRIMVLSYLNCVAADPSLQQQIMIFMIHEDLWDHATEEEKFFFHKPELTDKDLDTIFWRCESIWTLLWTLGKVEEIALPVREVDPQQIFSHLPGFFESSKGFVADAGTRAPAEILDHYDFIFRLNWCIMKGYVDESVSTINVAVTHERYVALNWVIEKDQFFY